MRVPLVQSIDRIIDLSQKNRWAFFESGKKMGSKISGFALERLGGSPKRSALLPDATASHVMLELLAAMAVAIRQDAKFEDALESVRSEKKMRSKKMHKKEPIGLHRTGENLWINAWLQFFFHLPKISELVFFAPKSFDPLRECIDQYSKDRQEGKEVSDIDPSSVLPCLPSKGRQAPETIDLYEIFQKFFGSIFPGGAAFHDSILFHPEWIIAWEGTDRLSLEKHVQKKIEEGPSEILLSLRQKKPFFHPPVQRQIFHPSGRYFYDLDAFIERRLDGSGAIFATYVRIGGIWYQCDDEKVRPVSTRNLSVPLCRGIFFHYQRLGL